MSSARRRRRRYVTLCAAFFGAFTAYACIMVVLKAEPGAGSGMRDAGCGACHDTSPGANAQTYQTWGGFQHEPVGGGNFAGVPSGFRM